MRSSRSWQAMALVMVAGTWACGGGGEPSAGGTGGPPASGSAAAELTAEQLELGIGPVRQLALGEVDEELAERGQAVFSLKCAACHKLDQRYVGPPLGGVLERRKPEFVMNMILNPAEMVERHPEVRAMLAQFMTPMPDQGLTEEEARAVLEYLRSAVVPDAGSAEGER